MSCVYYTDYHEIAITRNIFTGEMTLDSTSGFNISAPWVQASNIDIRPIRVCISSTTRNFNCRLVYFDKTHWKEFISLEGFRYYWWANRFSINFGYDEEYRGIKDVLRGYSFDPQIHNFIKVVEVE